MALSNRSACTAVIVFMFGHSTGELATALVREFLNYFELDYTCSVFDPETNAVS